MPLDPTRLGHLLFYKFSPHVHTTLKSLAMPLVRSAHSPLIPPPPPVFLVYNLTRFVPSNRHMLYALNTWDRLPKDLKDGFYKGVRNKHIM